MMSAYHVSSGECISQTRLNFDSMYVSSGGTAVDIDCYHGSIYIDDGASAANISGNYAYMYVSSGGAVDNIELDNGQIHISAVFYQPFLRAFCFFRVSCYCCLQIYLSVLPDRQN